VITDIHETHQAGERLRSRMSADPAFLCRQTDLLRAAAATGRAVNVKKGQFSRRSTSATSSRSSRPPGNRQIMITERGTSFGYNNLVVDMRAFPMMRQFGYPVVFDAPQPATARGPSGDSTAGQSNTSGIWRAPPWPAAFDDCSWKVHDNPPMALSDAATQFGAGQTRTAA